jgi:hypothetical protein
MFRFASAAVLVAVMSAASLSGPGTAQAGTSVVVSVGPNGPVPAPGFVWRFHQGYGWGWYHPRYGWYVRPVGVVPGPDFVWRYHPGYGWGWYHPRYGWYVRPVGHIPGTGYVWTFRAGYGWGWFHPRYGWFSAHYY